MDVLIVIVALALVAGLASAMHGFIKPAVDWLCPPAPPVVSSERIADHVSPQVEMWRASRQRREAWRDEDRRWRKRVGLD